jgi:hypothetical protein
VSKTLMTSEDLCVLESALQELEKLNRDFLSRTASRGDLIIQTELKTKIGIDPNDGRQHPLGLPFVHRSTRSDRLPPINPSRVHFSTL